MRVLLTVGLFIFPAVQSYAVDIVKPIRDVVERTFEAFPEHVTFKSIDKKNGHDIYALSVRKGRLTVEGSSPVVLCKGFHDYILENGYGIVRWTGNRLSLPKRLAVTTGVLS